MVHDFNDVGWFFLTTLFLISTVVLFSPTNKFTAQKKKPFVILYLLYSLILTKERMSYFYIVFCNRYRWSLSSGFVLFSRFKNIVPIRDRKRKAILKFGKKDRERVRRKSKNETRNETWGMAFDYLSKILSRVTFFPLFLSSPLSLSVCFSHTLIMHAILSTNLCLNDISNIWTVHTKEIMLLFDRWFITMENTFQGRHNLLWL